MRHVFFGETKILQYKQSIHVLKTKIKKKIKFVEEMHIYQK